jgi:YD repeat-containing protein
MVRIILVVALSFLLVSSVFGETVSVRDRSGKLIGTEKTDGDTTVVRDPQGKLIEKRVRRGNRIETRDPSGRLLRSETVR